MLTISQLAAYAGCTVKAVRVYHERGLLPEPARDASGYRRYDAQAVIDLTRIVTLAKAGVPLADIPAMLAAGDEEHREAVDRIDAELGAKIADLRRRRAKLALLRTPDRLCLPEPAAALLDRLRELGFSERYVAIERDAWILAVAMIPSVIEEYVPVKAALLEDDEYVDVTRRYDAALDWAVDDPRIDDLIDATVRLSVRLNEDDDDEAWNSVPPEVMDVLMTYKGDAPAWIAMHEMASARIDVAIAAAEATRASEAVEFAG